jgi:hypothetical protein
VLGPVTPTKVVSYGLCIAGLLLLLASRVAEPLQGGFWAGIALLLLGAGCLIDALLPGGSEISPEQVAMIRHIGLPYRDGADKVVNGVAGVLLLASGFYLIS